MTTLSKDNMRAIVKEELDRFRRTLIPSSGLPLAFLPIDGSLPMAGDLNMGENNILDVDLVDGVDLAQFFTFMNGAIVETVDVINTSDGITIKGTIEALGGGDLTCIFDGIEIILDTTPPLEIILVAGTDNNPVNNFIFVVESGGVASVSINQSGWPDGEYCPLATVLCQSAATAQADGILKSQLWIDHFSQDNANGHLSHVNERIRSQHALYDSGVSIGSLVSSGGVEFLSLGSGFAFQMHLAPIDDWDMETGDDLYVINEPGSSYNKIANLDGITQDLNGNSISLNMYINLVVMTTVSPRVGSSKVFCNLPTEAYVMESAALSDANKTAVYDIPALLKGSTILVARYILQLTPTGWMQSGIDDLRGKFPDSSAGGGGFAPVNYVDLLDTDSSLVANELQVVNSQGSGLINSGVGMFSGTGSPEGVVTANEGDFYSRRDGENSSIYIKRGVDGTNTDWRDLTLAGGGSVILEWNWSTNTVDVDPGTGVIKGNDAIQADITQLFVDEETAAGQNVDSLLSAMESGDIMLISEEGDSSRWISFELNGVSVDGTGYWKLPGTVVQNGNAIRNGRTVAAQVFWSGTGTTTLLGLTDTFGVFNADRIPFESGSTLTDSEDFKYSTVAGIEAHLRLGESGLLLSSRFSMTNTTDTFDIIWSTAIADFVLSNDTYMTLDGESAQKGVIFNSNGMEHDFTVRDNTATAMFTLVAATKAMVATGTLTLGSGPNTVSTPAGLLVANKIDIAGAAAAVVASGDLVLVADISDSDTPKIVTAQSIADLGAGGGGPSFGTLDQIPHMNAGGDDFDYSANLIYDGTFLQVTTTGSDAFQGMKIIHNGTGAPRIQFETNRHTAKSAFGFADSGDSRFVLFTGTGTNPTVELMQFYEGAVFFTSPLNVYFLAGITHLGDTDTKINLLDDRFQIQSGAVIFFDAIQSTTNTLALGVNSATEVSIASAGGKMGVLGATPVGISSPYTSIGVGSRRTITTGLTLSQLIEVVATHVRDDQLHGHIG